MSATTPNTSGGTPATPWAGKHQPSSARTGLAQRGAEVVVLALVVHHMRGPQHG